MGDAAETQSDVEGDITETEWLADWKPELRRRLAEMRTDPASCVSEDYMAARMAELRQRIAR